MQKITRTQLAITLFALLGLALLISVRASSPTTSLEVESLSLTNATLLDDNTASQGKYIAFSEEQTQTEPLFSFDFNDSSLGPYLKEDIQREWRASDFITSDGYVFNARDNLIDILEEDGNKFMRKVFPANSCCNGDHGSSWLFRFNESFDELYFSYRVRTSDNWDPSRGGKIPGLCGGECNSGGEKPNGSDGWSARNMWRQESALVQYVYHADQPEVYGQDFRYDSSKLTSEWQQIEHKITINTPDRNDGRIEAWVDGQKRLDQTGLRFRSIDDFAIDSLLFATFYGGNQPSWAPSRTTHLDFDDLVISTSPITH